MHADGGHPVLCQRPSRGNFLLNNATAGTYTATLWVRADTPRAALTLSLRQMLQDGQTVAGEANTTITLRTDWQPVTVQYTTVSALPLQFNASVTGAAPGTCFYADTASIAIG